jgi:hypothetical protein
MIPFGERLGWVAKDAAIFSWTNDPPKSTNCQGGANACSNAWRGNRATYHNSKTSKAALVGVHCNASGGR